MIMTVMKVLELITGHNTSFSALIRKLIGNKLLCISKLWDFLHNVWLSFRARKMNYLSGFLT